MADRPPDRSQVVRNTLVIWIAAHLLLLGILGIPGYVQCTSAPFPSGNIFGSCGLSLGLIALAIGWIQLAYGLIGSVIVYARGRRAISQGMLIGAPLVAFAFTLLCFGSLFAPG